MEVKVDEITSRFHRRGRRGHEEQKEFRRFETRSLPSSLAAALRGFAFYLSLNPWLDSQIHTDLPFGCRHFFVLRHSCFVIPSIRVIRESVVPSSRFND